MISIVVARSSNGVIGREGELPWHLPSDMKRFRELTMGHAVLMGRATFESLPQAYRPLPGRRNLVLTSDHAGAGDLLPGAELFADLESALRGCARDCFVAGGGITYAHALPLAERVYATEVESEVEGDAFFPALSPGEWRCIEQDARMFENGHTFSFRTYERTSPSPL